VKPFHGNLNLNEEILVKKTLTYLLAVLALVAVASSAMAVTCTIDQRPAATLLVPYFQVHLNPDGSVDTSATRTDTLITVVNASSAATLAHVVIWNRRSVPLLDFNIALTGYDIVGWSMEDVLTGTIPSTPDNGSFEGKDVCQRNPKAQAYSTDGPDSDGSFLRFRPSNDTTGQDNNQATTQYSSPAFGADFAADLADALDYDSNWDCDGDGDDGSAPDGDITGSSVAGNGNLSGYVTIDMANFCSLSNPSVGAYWDQDAAGWENNLFGDYIIVTNSGIPTLGASTVQIEAALDTVITADNFFGSSTSSPTSSFIPFGAQPFNDPPFENRIPTPVRTFYARYWEDTSAFNFADTGVINNGDEGVYMAAVFPFVTDTFGDNREPLGVRYGVRYLNSGGLTSNLRVWRASADDLTDLTGHSCSAKEAAILATVFDSDEGTQQINGCPSPCPKTSLNFPYETQRTGVDQIGALAVNGWAYLNFLGAESNVSSDKDLDQAWVDYEMSSGVAFVNASIPGTQLDPSTCHPEGLDDLFFLGDEQIFAGFYPWPVGLGHN
jgi:hypothetical protein